MAAEPRDLLHPDARAELREAVLWHREHTAHAVAFVEEVSRVIVELAQAPERWPLLKNVSPPTRYRVLPTYPYTIFYRHTGVSVLVLAVAHQRRQPLYWTHRH